MEKDSYTLQSVLDGTRLAVTEIIPPEVRFCVQIAHGMAEHRLRYEPFMTYLAEAGGAVIIHDMRGHGETAGEKNYGYFGENAVEGVLSDTDQVGGVLRRRYPDAPFILLGHSMGTLVARAYAAGHDEKLDGLILLGEISAYPAVNGGLALVRILSLFRGGRARSGLLDSISLSPFSAAFPEETDPNAWLSVNEENRRAYAADPACGFRFTLNGYETLYALLKRAYQPKRWNVRRPEMPICFFSGEDDPVMTSRRRFNGAARFLSDMGYRCVTAKLCPGMRHEILNETGREEIWREILGTIAGIGKYGTAPEN
jgi:alpha-beta hydrolase superfamily lysophospholipase